MQTPQRSLKPLVSSIAKRLLQMVAVLKRRLHLPILLQTTIVQRLPQVLLVAIPLAPIAMPEALSLMRIRCSTVDIAINGVQTTPLMEVSTAQVLCNTCLSFQAIPSAAPRGHSVTKSRRTAIGRRASISSSPVTLSSSTISTMWVCMLVAASLSIQARHVAPSACHSRSTCAGVVRSKVEDLRSRRFYALVPSELYFCIAHFFVRWCL